MFGRKRPVRKILVVLDWDNLCSNGMPNVHDYSLTEGFKRLVEQLTQVGQIVSVFVFGPPDSIIKDLRSFRDEGFWPVPCPRETDKRTRDQVDVVDRSIITFVRDMLEHMPDLTHICIGSGDSDFAKPLAKEAKRRGKEVIVVCGSLRSLSKELREQANDHPITGEKMVFIFSPTVSKK